GGTVVMYAAMSLKNVLKKFDKSLADLDREMRLFSKSARVFSSDVPRLIDKYENKWVAVVCGDVIAAEDTLEDLTDQIRKLDLSPAQTLIRHIDREPKTFVL